MKSNTTLKIVATISMIMCVMAMSGCLTSDDAPVTDTVIDDAVTIDEATVGETTDDAPTTPTKAPASGDNDLPITAYVDLAQLHEDIDDPDIMRFVLSEDETVVVCADTMQGDDCAEGIWKPYGSAGNEYDIIVEPFCDIRVTVLPDGEAEFLLEGTLVLEGAWEK